MRTLFRSTFLVVLTLALPVAAFASASESAEALNVPGNRDVTRFEFLRASIIVLGLSVQDDTERSYLRAANDKGALAAFGAAPDLSQSITRGEALLLVAKLRRWDGTGAVLSFRDVDAATDLGAAVKLSAQNGWMQPLRQNVFGVSALLRAKEARSVLTRASSDAAAPKVIKIKVTSKKQSPVSFTSKKFRDQIRLLLGNEYLYGDKLKSGTGMTASEFVDSLKDPYTTLLDPKEAQEFKDQLGGTLTGIGTHIEFVENALVVVSVIEGSPAERAGIEAGDTIVTVNGKKLAGLNFNDAVRRIRGPEGTPVRVGVIRDGDPLMFNMLRAVIDIPDTTVTMRSNVAIVKVAQFGDHLLKDADDVFAGVLAEGPEGIILDLRDNPGGYLEAGAALAGQFLPNGSVYVRTHGRAINDSYVTDREPSVPVDLPVIVLVNEASASAAEIVAGALQDAGRATLVGKTTFGKGTVQTVYPFQNKSSLKFTIAEWLTPDSHPIDKVGIVPDVEVEQGDAGDLQLEHALTMLLSGR